MKLSNKTTFYLYLILLFFLTYLLASRIIKGIYSHEFNYIKIGVNTLVLAYTVTQVIKLGKKENDQSE